MNRACQKGGVIRVVNHRPLKIYHMLFGGLVFFFFFNSPFFPLLKHPHAVPLIWRARWKIYSIWDRAHEKSMGKKEAISEGKRQT